MAGVPTARKSKPYCAESCSISAKNDSFLIQGPIPFFFFVPFPSRSKAALKMFGEILATEESDITTVSIRPGVVDTGMQEVIREKGKKTTCNCRQTNNAFYFTKPDADRQ